MEKIKLVNERRITVGVYAYDFEMEIVVGNKTFYKLITCGTNPQVIYNLLHRGHNEPCDDENVMVYYHDKERGDDYETMPFSRAKETFGLYM